MKNLRFWQKTYLFTLSLFLIALWGGISVIGWQTQRQMVSREIDNTKSEQHFIAQNLSADLSSIESNINLRIPALVRSYGQYYAQNGVLMEVSHGDENTLFSNLPAYTGERPELRVEGKAQYWAARNIDGTQYSLVASRLSGGFEGYILVCARSLSPLDEAWAQIKQTLAVGSGLVSVVLAVGLFFVLRGLSKPLERLARAADKFAAGNFSARAIKTSNDEIGNLAQSLNAMADAAERQIEEIRKVAEQNERMSANLSHEIRTPLTAIQGYAEYMRLAELTAEEQDTALQYIVDESTRLQKISQRMLKLFTLEHDDFEMKPVQLAEVIRRVSLSVRPKAEQVHVDLNIHPVPDGEILGDDILLESLFINILDNAIKACSANGEVRLCAEQTEKCITITIEDNGRGLEKQELEMLGEPFYRPDKSRSRQEGGAGLGVALCRRIAGLHGASLSYRSAPQKGTAAMIKFTTL